MKLTQVEKTECHNINSFASEFGVTKEEIEPYTHEEVEVNLDKDLVEQIQGTDYEVIRNILEQREDLYHITYKPQNLGSFIIQQVEIRVTNNGEEKTVRLEETEENIKATIEGEAK